MFAPKVAKAQTKSTTSSTNGLPPKRSAFVGYQSVRGPVEQMVLRQRAIGNLAALRLPADRPASLTWTEPDGNHDQEIALENATAREVPGGASWDFSKIPLFPPDQIDRSQPRFSLSAPPRMGVIQTKLSVGEVNDPLEDEADRVANQMMRMTGPMLSIAAASPQVSRKSADCEEKGPKTLRTKPTGVPATFTAEAPSPVRTILGSPGRPLDAAARAYFEPRFGQDFSHLRIHTDRTAGEAARSLGALAYTTGSDIVFAEGQYQPGTESGKKLLAHELAHTIQQIGVGTAEIRCKIGDGHDLRSPRFARNPVLEAVYDDELLIGVESHTRGDHVRHIQESLLAQGYALPGSRADGLFGAETEAAVIQFQRDAGALKVDGIVGPETMGLLDTHDPSNLAGSGPVAKIGPVLSPLRAPASGCDRPFAGVKFALEDQVAKGVSPAATIRIVRLAGKDVLEMQGRTSAFYRPSVTITAPDDKTAMQFQVGFIQNLLSVDRSAIYDRGTVVRTVVPTVPIKDGEPLTSGKYDPVFMEAVRSMGGTTDKFSENDETVDLRFEDNPRWENFINLLDNRSCVNPLPETVSSVTIHDQFRTWLAVRHQPTGCVKALHHMDWNLLWSAIVTMLGNFPALTITSNVISVTVASGDGRPSFLQGGPVAKDIVFRTCL